MDTGPGLHEEHLLRDGTAVILRHIRPGDAAALKAGLERLSPESRYRRFLERITRLSDAQVEYLTRVDGKDHVAIVAVLADGTGLGVARFVRLPGDPQAAEAAITVIDDMQGKGLGYLLSIALARAAWERGVRRFRGRILAENPTVQQMLVDLGARLEEPRDGGVAFEVELTPTPFTPGSPLDLMTRRLLRAAAGAFGAFLGPLAQP